MLSERFRECLSARHFRGTQTSTVSAGGHKAIPSIIRKQTRSFVAATDLVVDVHGLLPTGYKDHSERMRASGNPNRDF